MSINCVEYLVVKKKGKSSQGGTFKKFWEFKSWEE